MREGESNNLAGIGSIGEDLLIAGEGSVEYNFGFYSAGRAKANAFNYGTVRKHKNARALGNRPGCGLGWGFGHGVHSCVWFALPWRAHDKMFRQRHTSVSTLTLKGYRSEEHTSELQSRENLVCR